MGLKAMLKKSRFTYGAALALKRAPEPFLRAFMNICHAIKGVDQNKVYFSSFSGKLCNESPRYVAQALHQICPEAKIVFRLNAAGRAQSDLPDYVRAVPQFSPAALCAMATARVIVKNARFKPYMKKFPDQTYIQLWHGDRGFKKIGYDLEPEAARKYIDWRYMDLCVSGSDFGTGVYRSAFRYRGEVLECGCPKNDVLIAAAPAIAADVRRELQIDAGARVLLYAPTFRDKSTGSTLTANLSLRRLKAALAEKTGEPWTILTRAHTLNSGVRADAGRDVSAYADVSRLLLAVDVLVTDYSSIAGDFLLLNRPVVLYQADRAAFTAGDRTLYYDPEQSPYHVAHSEAELADAIAGFGDAAENCTQLKKYLGVKESGQASQIVAERIRDLLKK